MIRAASQILCVGKPEKLSRCLPRHKSYRYLIANSFKKARQILSTREVKIFLSYDISDLEAIKKDYPGLVRILLMDRLDQNLTHAAVNRAEVFQFLVDSTHPRDKLRVFLQGIEQFELETSHRRLLADIKTQNQKLEKLVFHLESKIHDKARELSDLEEKLKKKSMDLEQLTKLIAWIHASSEVDELEERLFTSLHGILPVERVIVSERSTEETVREIKKTGFSSMVFPLIYQKGCIGNLYYLYQREKGASLFYERLDFLKQIADAVSLTLAKIHIFDESVKRKVEWEKTFDAIKDPVSLVNKQYEIVRANRAYSDVSAVKLQDLIGRKCYEVFQKRESVCEGCLLEQALNRDEARIFELKSLAQQTFYTTASFPIKTDPAYAVMYYRDHGEEMKLRDQLIQTEKMAEIGILSGSVAHEINNPLGGIIAYVQILLSEVDKKSALCADFKEIEMAAIRSKNIVESLLNFSRASRKEDRAPVNLASVLEKAISLVQLKIRHRNIQIEKRYSEVPAIYGDFNQLVQVFLNILNNSVEALEERKRGEGWIGIDLQLQGESVVVKMGDNGGGVGMADLSKIFNPFFTTKDRQSHAGLGLSVSYRIVREHGGDIKIENQPRDGINFIVTFPTKY